MVTTWSSSCKHGLQSAGALRPTWQHRRRSSRDVNDTASLNQFNPRILKTQHFKNNPAEIPLESVAITKHMVSQRMTSQTTVTVVLRLNTHSKRNKSTDYNKRQ